jgi:hypothetical protein
MPTVAWFYGIAIAMYYNDHNPPHFHAQYGQSRASSALPTGGSSRDRCRLRPCA